MKALDSLKDIISEYSDFANVNEVFLNRVAPHPLDIEIHTIDDEGFNCNVYREDNPIKLENWIIDHTSLDNLNNCMEYDIYFAIDSPLSINITLLPT